MNLRIGVRHGENQRVRCHLLDHVLGHAITGRQTEENVCAFHSLCQCALVSLARVAGFEFVHALLSALVNKAFTVAHEDVFTLQAEAYDEIRAGHTRRAGTRDDEFDLFHLFAGELQP